LRYFLIEVYDEEMNYTGTWCSLAMTVDKAIADCMDNCGQPVQLSNLYVKNMHQNGWTTPYLDDLEEYEGRQLATLSLLNEATVKLKDSAKPPTNLLKRIHNHFEDCC